MKILIKIIDTEFMLSIISMTKYTMLICREGNSYFIDCTVV